MSMRLWREPLDKEKIKRSKAEIHIIQDQCKGCEYCIEFCPREVLEKSGKFNKRGVHFPKVKDEGKCILCSICSAICPDFAIFVIEKQEVDSFNG